MSASIKLMPRCVLVIAVTVVLTWPLAAAADGTHGTSVKVVNYGCKNLHVYTYNGGDLVCAVRHKSYTAFGEDGEVKTVKCHGQGKGRCKLSARALAHMGTPVEAVEDILNCKAVAKGDTFEFRLGDDGCEY